MKKIKESLSEESKRKRKHPVMQKLSAVLLSVCLLVVSLPLDFFGVEVQAEEVQRNVVSFSELPDEVRYQAADIGTPVDDLNLSDTLEAVCVSERDSSNTFKEETSESEKETPENTEQMESVKETVVIEHVTWESNPSYDGQTEGTYTFHPIIPESYRVTDSVELPAIEIRVKQAEQREEENQETGEQEESQETEESEEGQETEEPTGEAELSNDLEGKSEEEEGEEFIERQFQEADDMEEDIMEMEDTAEEDEMTGPIVVDSNVEWGETASQIMRDCTVTVKPGVTLRMGRNFQTEGNVVIEGGGKIKGKESFGFTVMDGSTLTLRNITLDGEGGCEFLIKVETGGKLFLESGCIIENMVGGPLIHFGEHGEGVFQEGAAIRNCSCKKETYDLIRNENSKLTINGGTYEGNQAVTFLLILGSEEVNINGCVFRNNYSSFISDNESLVGYYDSKKEPRNITITGGLFQNNGLIFSSLNGLIAFGSGTLTITGGIFSGNITGNGGKDDKAGSIYIMRNRSDYPKPKVYITGGTFTGNRGNSSKSSSCIYLGDGEMYISGGVFSRNYFDRSTIPGGAIYVDYPYNPQLFLTGEAKFNINRTLPESMREAIYFNNDSFGPQKFYLEDSLNTPIKVCLNSWGSTDYEGYVVCEGSGDYILTEEDAKRIIVTDMKDTEKKWGRVVDKENNQIYLSSTEGMEEYEPKEVTADFYSGGEFRKESKNIELSNAKGIVTTPQLKRMSGWTSLGWNYNVDEYTGEIEENTDVTLTEDTSFYGVYQKNITLSYNLNGGEGATSKEETKSGYANVHGEILYRFPEFQLAEAPTRNGYLFQGWSSLPEGEGGDMFAPKDKKIFDKSTTLYAIWEKSPDTATDSYKVEHYLQDVEGDGYTLLESDTEILSGKEGSTVTAEPKNYEGFTENQNHPERKVSGTLGKTENLVLKFYYDRNIYEVNFDLNGGEGTAPKTQYVRYGGLLQQVTEPGRRGYNFKGWHLRQDGIDAGLWEFGVTVEKNTSSLQTTLYAEWKDELAPEAGKASFSSGHKNFLNWVIQKRDLVITVPVTEEGSGLAEAFYTMEPEQGKKTKGKAQIFEKPTENKKSLSYGSGASLSRILQKGAGSGKYESRITVEENFKGKVSITCKEIAPELEVHKQIQGEIR